MDQVHVIRHKHLVEGRSVRRDRPRTGPEPADRREISPSVRTQRVELVARPQPVMGVAGPRIEALLKEWAPRIEGKHRFASDTQELTS